VAFSGGVDSSLVLWAAARARGGDVLALTAQAEVFPAWEDEAAAAFAAELGVPHRRVAVEVLDLPEFRANPVNRCYHCKRRLMEALLAVARAEGRALLLDGTTADDRAAERPGQRAARELGVASPLVEVGLDKAAGRALLRRQGLPVAERPSNACLASRVPFGEPIDAARLKRIAAAEEVLRRQGFAGVRVRDHHPVARLEVPLADLPRLCGPCREAVEEQIRRLGFPYVAADLRGFRSGSLHEA
jgi:uncharacterized protein